MQKHTPEEAAAQSQAEYMICKWVPQGQGPVDLLQKNWSGMVATPPAPALRPECICMDCELVTSARCGRWCWWN